MANANSTPCGDAARLLTHSYDHSNWYKGTESELVSAGIVKSEWLPGLHGNAKTCTRVGLINGEMRLLPQRVIATRYQKENGLIHISRLSKSKFDVRVSKTQAETDQEIERENAERERRNLRAKVERMHAEKQRALEAAPKSHQEFLESRKSIIKACLEGIFNQFRRADNGYHYSREVIKEAHDLMCDLFALADEGKVYFDQKRQDYFMDDVEKKAAEYAAKEFPEFSAFMAATLAIGKAAALD